MTTQTERNDREDIPHDRYRGKKAITRAATSQIALTTVTVITIGAIWEYLSWLDPRLWPEIILSKPTEIVPAFLEAVTTGFVWRNFWVTLQEVVIGFAIGASGGFILGALVALVSTFRKAFYPIIILIQSMPKSALAPMFIAWFGFGITSKVALAITICFFPVLVNTVTGLTTVDEHSFLLMRSLRASTFQIFTRLRMPAALPAVFAGLKTALTLALIGAIVGELVGASEGAGHLIATATFQFRMDDVFAYLLMLAFFGLALFSFSEAIERKIVFWHGDTD